jgi:hypothetical protein
MKKTTRNLVNNLKSWFHFIVSSVIFLFAIRYSSSDLGDFGFDFFFFPELDVLPGRRARRRFVGISRGAWPQDL